MRTLLVSTLLVAATAAADPDPLASPAKVAVTEVTVTGSGGVDPEIARRAFDAALDAARRCYADAKGRVLAPAVTVTVKFRVDARGAVAKASAVGLPSMNSCITTAINALVFDAPSQGAIDVTEKLRVREPPTAGILGSLTAVKDGPMTKLGTIGTISGDLASDGGLLGEPAPGGGLGRDAPTGYGTPGGARRTQGGTLMVSLGQPTVQGDLDRAIVRRYVKRNLKKIQDCYEKQLVTRPALAGTLQLQFAIDGDGKVTSSSGSGVDPAVASCAAEVVQHIEFPRPKSGPVQVSYALGLHVQPDDKKP
jgi:hypothetical protein